MSERLDQSDPIDAGLPRRGLVRLILGTLCITGAFSVLPLAVGIGRADLTLMAMLYAALGAFLTWSGSHDKEGWQRPLGICWIVGALSLAGNYLGQMRTSAVRSNPLPGRTLFLVGAVIMGIVGCLLVFVKKRPGGPRGSSGTQNRFVG